MIACVAQLVGPAVIINSLTGRPELNMGCQVCVSFGNCTRCRFNVDFDESTYEILCCYGNILTKLQAVPL